MINSISTVDTYRIHAAIMDTHLPQNVNLDGSQQPKLLGTIISTYLLSVLAVALRFQSRKLSKVEICWDDWMVLLALVVSTAANIVPLAWMIPDGFGKHIYGAPPGAVSEFFKALFFGELTIFTTFAISQISVLLLYRRIFQTRYVIVLSYIVGVLITLWSLGFFLTTMLQCIPLRAFWDRSILRACGVDTKKFFLGQAIPHTFIDVAILCIPMRPVWNLHISTRYKISVTFMFLMGGLTVAISIVRLVYLLNVDLTSIDITWNFVDFLIWTCLEASFGIISACLPCLRPALSFYFSFAKPIFPQRHQHGTGKSSYQSTWHTLPETQLSFQSIELEQGGKRMRHREAAGINV